MEEALTALKQVHSMQPQVVAEICCQNPDCDTEGGCWYVPTGAEQLLCPQCLSSGELELWCSDDSSSEYSEDGCLRCPALSKSIDACSLINPSTPTDRNYVVCVASNTNDWRWGCSVRVFPMACPQTAHLACGDPNPELREKMLH